MIWIGTSGYSYPEWKGSFYPKDLPTKKMLPYYAERFNTVEINNTFYRMPTASTIENWLKEVPSNFKFTFKAPQKITHHQRLKECKELVTVFFETVKTAGSQFGMILFQLPPNLKKDLPRLEGFLESLPRGMPSAFEFRHESWFDEEIYAALKTHGVSLCIADSEKLKTPVTATSDFGYFRLRDEGYRKSDIKLWAELVEVGKFKEVFIYFKHEQEGRGPQFANIMKASLKIG
jgi:uncharacterized protein YecE (DUF72 family)